MTITYADGRTNEAVILSRTENTVRFALNGSEDVAVFTDVNGTWVSEDCEAVQVEFAWQRHLREQSVVEADCICSRDLAARLIHLLLAGEAEEKNVVETPLPNVPEALATHRIV